MRAFLTLAKRPGFPLHVRVCVPAIGAVVLLALGLGAADAQVVSSNLLAVEKTQSIGPGESAGVLAACESGEVATGGGFDASSQQVELTTFYPTATPKGWQGDFTNTSSSVTYQVTVWALCAPVANITVTPSGNVGIGTTNPSGVKLNVKSNASFDGFVVEANSNDAWLRLGHSGSLARIESTYLSTAGNQPLAIKVGGSDRMYFDTNGNVGIGTISPVDLLHVQGDAAGGNSFNGRIQIGSHGYIRSEGYLPTWLSLGGEQWDSGIRFDVRKSDGTQLPGAVIIASDGNVGIGTTSPGSKLDVAGDIATTGVVKMGYRVVTGPSVQIGFNSSVSPSVSCAVGELPLSGAWNGTTNSSLNVFRSQPAGSAWAFGFRNDGPVGITVRLQVICARIAP